MANERIIPFARDFVKPGDVVEIGIPTPYTGLLSARLEVSQVQMGSFALKDVSGSDWWWRKDDLRPMTGTGLILGILVE